MSEATLTMYQSLPVAKRRKVDSFIKELFAEQEFAPMSGKEISKILEKSYRDAESGKGASWAVARKRARSRYGL